MMFNVPGGNAISKTYLLYTTRTIPDRVLRTLDYWNPRRKTFSFELSKWHFLIAQPPPTSSPLVLNCLRGDGTPQILENCSPPASSKQVTGYPGLRSLCKVSFFFSSRVHWKVKIFLQFSQPGLKRNIGLPFCTCEVGWSQLPGC